MFVHKFLGTSVRLFVSVESFRGVVRPCHGTPLNRSTHGNEICSMVCFVLLRGVKVRRCMPCTFSFSGVPGNTYFLIYYHNYVEMQKYLFAGM